MSGFIGDVKIYLCLIVGLYWYVIKNKKSGDYLIKMIGVWIILLIFVFV